MHEQPQRARLLSWLRLGVCIHKFLLDASRGPSLEFPFRDSYFQGEVYSNRVQASFHEFVHDDIRSLAHRGCIVSSESVRSRQSPMRPRLIQALSVELVKPRLMYDERPLNKCCKHVSFVMDTVGTVAQIGCQGCFQGSLDHKSGYHILLHPQSWVLCGFTWREMGYVWTIIPFGWNESPVV